MSTEPHDEEPVNREITASPDQMTEVDGDEGEVRGAGNGHADVGGAQDEGDSDGEGDGSEGSDEEDEETDEEEEDDEDDDEEPALKYERFGGIVPQLLQKDSASALAYSNQRLVSALSPSSSSTIRPTPSPTCLRLWALDRKSTRLNSSHSGESRMPSSA